MFHGAAHGRAHFGTRHPIAPGGQSFAQRGQFQTTLVDLLGDGGIQLGLAEGDALSGLPCRGLSLGDGGRQGFDVPLQLHHLLLQGQIVRLGVIAALEQGIGDVALLDGQSQTAICSSTSWIFC